MKRNRPSRSPRTLVPERAPVAARAKRTPLTRDGIVIAAIALIERQGENALTMRRLGAALGVEAMALYNHFDDRDAILDAIADRVFDAVPLPAPAGRWRERLRVIAHSMRHAALVQPNVFRIAMSRPTKPTRALPLMDAALGALRQAGLTEPQRVQAYHVLASFIRGFITWELDQSCLVQTHATTSSPSRTPLPSLTANIASAFPEIAAVGTLFGTQTPEAIYAAAIELLLNALEAHAREKPPPGRTARPSR